MTEELTLQQIADLLATLFTNMNNLDNIYYDLFINNTPMDITLERYDEQGVKREYVIPNRAKDKIVTLQGYGSPNGNVTAVVGVLYINLDNFDLYYKASGTDSLGWALIRTTTNFREGHEFLHPAGNGSMLHSLNAGSLSTGLVAPDRGGLGANNLNGILKGNGGNPATVAIPNVDYLVGSAFTGVVLYVARNTAPNGWLMCDGSAINRVTYADLFSIIGTAFGVGDNSTTFNLPMLTDNRYIQGSTNVGALLNAGLPNIYGSFKYQATGYGGGGAFGLDGSMGYAFGGTVGTVTVGYNFYASRCSDIYGASDTVQPKSIRLLPIIKF